MERRTASWPRVLNALHVRVPLLFLGLLALLGAVYYSWMVHTVFAPPKLDPEEERWYYKLAAVQMDSLAALAAVADADLLQAMAREYGERIAVYEGEVIFFEAETGRVLAASDPDSLAKAIGAVDPQMLRDMAGPDWSFATDYPDPSNIDAYVNRIFHVSAVAGPDGMPIAYLAGSYRPVILTLEDVTLNARKLWLQAIIVGLAGSFLVGWVVMAWLTRRIKTLSIAAESLASGQLSHRVHDRSSDDLGRLGRDFNAMAARLEELVGQLRNKEQFQRQLVANISHDLRTPLSSLRGYIETLALSEERPAPETYRRYLMIINSNLDHMERLIDQLLQLSRLDAGQMPVQSEDFHLHELVDSVLDRCRAHALGRGVTLACRIPDDLPLVHADPVQIGQVLQNLVENGIKFGRENGEVAVEVLAAGRDGARQGDDNDHRDSRDSSQGDDRAIRVIVRDDGPGIPEDELPHIFERFYTGDASRSRKGRSNGLGLAIAVKIIEGHGSRLTVASETGRGSRFSFTLNAAAHRESKASHA